MFVIAYTVLVAAEKHDHIQFSLYVEVLYIRYYNSQSVKFACCSIQYTARILKCIFSCKEILE